MTEFHRNVRGVRCIRSAGRELWGGVLSTSIDPEGNCPQLIEYKQEERDDD